MKLVKVLSDGVDGFSVKPRDGVQHPKIHSQTVAS